MSYRFFVPLGVAIILLVIGVYCVWDWYQTKDLSPAPSPMIGVVGAGLILGAIVGIVVLVKMKPKLESWNRSSS